MGIEEIHFFAQVLLQIVPCTGNIFEFFLLILVDAFEKSLEFPLLS